MKKLNLSRLMYAGYAGGSRLKGETPDRVIAVRRHRSVRRPGDDPIAAQSS